MPLLRLSKLSKENSKSNIRRNATPKLYIMAKPLLVPLVYLCVSAASGPALPKDSNKHSQKLLSHTKWNYYTYSNIGPIHHSGSNQDSGTITKQLQRDSACSPYVVFASSLTDQRYPYEAWKKIRNRILPKADIVSMPI